MEAIKKQATKLREQVAKQQQAILRQLGHLGHESVMVDEAELEIHQRLQELYMSTRAAKHFQRDIVRGVEGYISTSKKQMEIARKLAENCYKYGSENQNGPSTLRRVAMEFGTSQAAMEDQREIMLGVLGQQVCEPLRASIHGARLEDARHLTHRYDRMRQEFESQATEVIRRQSKFREASTESLAKLKNAETRLSELKSSVLVLGKEATDAMLSVEEEQQQITLQKLLTMVDAERSYHQNVVSILEKLHSEMLVEEQLNESSPQSSNSPRVLHDTTSNGTEHPEAEDKSPTYFIAKVMHSFDAQADSELSLEVGDYVVVRKVAPNGWSEGECNGKSNTLKLVMGCLKKYEENSGQLINKDKSCFIMNDNITTNRINIVSNILQVQRKEFPINYLGCPLFHGRKRIYYFTEVVTKIPRRLGIWHCKQLSSGGKIILIKHVLSTMPVHLLSICHPPKTIMQQMERIFAKFLWGSIDGRNKHHWVAWRKLSRPTTEGGIGIRSLQDMSDSLGAKLWWQFRTKSSLWSEFLKSKYASRIHLVARK